MFVNFLRLHLTAFASDGEPTIDVRLQIRVPQEAVFQAVIQDSGECTLLQGQERSGQLCSQQKNLHKQIGKENLHQMKGFFHQ